MKTKIIGSAPVLLVKDVVASANYYRDKLGFNYEQLWGDPPCFVILDRDNFHLMLSQVEDGSQILANHKVVENLWDVYFWVNDVSRLYEEVKSNGVIIDYDLCDQPYGCREFGIQDIDGHDIAFGQDLGDD